MNVLILSWEFPPKVVGGLGRHVFELSKRLIKKGEKVYVVTWGFPGALAYESIEKIEVYRSQVKNEVNNFLELAIAMNTGMQEISIKLLSDNQIDVVHAHDWMVAPSALEIKQKYETALVSTIHSTEVGRMGNIQNGYQMVVHEMEHALINSSDQLIVCSNYMRNQVRRLFGGRVRISVIPNGIDRSKFDFPLSKISFRRKIAADNEKIVLFVGRLVSEKGVHVLMGAIPDVLRKIPDVKLVIAGDGYQRAELEKIADFLDISDRVLFTGHVDDRILFSLFRVADLAVFPSLYEPFGMVALEAMGAKTPIIVSDVGGFSEIVYNMKTGIKVPKNSSIDIASAIIKILSDQKFAKKLANQAYRVAVNRYGWENIAIRTKKIYKNALHKLAKRKKVSIITYRERGSLPEELLWHFYSVRAIDATSAISISPDEKGISREHIRKSVEAGLLSPIHFQGRESYYITEKGMYRIFSYFS